MPTAIPDWVSRYSMHVHVLLSIFLLSAPIVSSEYSRPGSRHRRANAFSSSKFRTVTLPPPTRPFDQILDASSTARERTLGVASLPASEMHGTLSHEPGHSGLQDKNRSTSEAAPAAYGIAGLSYADSAFNTYPGPSRSSGKLFMYFGEDLYICSATMIGKSLLLTAAHCVFNYGANSDGGYANSVYFAPAYKAAAPYGTWYARELMVPVTYYDGTDTCLPDAAGIVCNNDLALVWLEPGGYGSPRQAGDVVGYMDYGWNYYGFAAPNTFLFPFASMPSTAMMTQLGYPLAFDGAQVMQVSHSPGFPYTVAETTSGQPLANVVRGTSMTGGSSGGPWIVNYGVDAITYLSYGMDAARNVIMAVTSWGYVDSDIKLQGASSFGQNFEYPLAAYGDRGAGNIGYLVYAACDDPQGWRLQEQGFCRPPSPCSTAPVVAIGNSALDVLPTGLELTTVCGRIYNANYYKFIPQESGPYVFSTCSLTAWDTFIAVTTGCSTDSAVLTCDDDGCEQSAASTTPPVVLEAQTTYYVVLGGYSSANFGSATLLVQRISTGGFIDQTSCKLYSYADYNIPSCNNPSTSTLSEGVVTTPRGYSLFYYSEGVCTSQDCARDFLYTNSTITSIEDCYREYDENFAIYMFTYNTSACNFYGRQPSWPMTSLGLYQVSLLRTKQ